MEYFDVLDCRGEKTSGVISRDEAHRSGVWHGAFHCLVIYEKGGRGYAVLQKRSASKKIAPGRFDVSVGGHYGTGEGPESAGPREIREELGIEVKFGELVPLGRRIFVYCFEPGTTEYEFQDVFLLPRTIQPGEARPQAEEVDYFLEMDVEQGIGLLNGEARSMTGRLLSSGREGRTQVITAEAFVPCLDNYYIKLLLLARKYLQGQRKHLFI